MCEWRGDLHLASESFKKLYLGSNGSPQPLITKVGNTALLILHYRSANDFMGGISLIFERVEWKWMCWWHTESFSSHLVMNLGKENRVRLDFSAASSLTSTTVINCLYQAETVIPSRLDVFYPTILVNLHSDSQDHHLSSSMETHQK